MRFICIAVLFHLLCHSSLIAGTLSRARDAVRNQPSATQRSEADDSTAADQPSDDRPTGKLAQARSQVRRQQQHDGHHSGGSYLRPPRRVHGGGAFGFFAFDRCPSHCPPPPSYPTAVVETHIVHPPVYAPGPPGVYDAYPEPVVASRADTLFRQFTPYPYATEGRAFMLTGSPGVGKPWLGQLSLEGGSDFSGVDRTGVGLLLESAGGWGLEFGWDSYTEQLPSNEHDELHIGELGLLYRVVETDQALVRLGLGTTWLGDRYDADYGLNFSIRADYAPCDPLIVTGELDLGKLGDAEHMHAAGTLGVIIHRCELYGGYDYRRIGDAKIAGPLVGLRLWF